MNLFIILFEHITSEIGKSFKHASISRISNKLSYVCSFQNKKMIPSLHSTVRTKTNIKFSRNKVLSNLLDVTESLNVNKNGDIDTSRGKNKLRISFKIPINVNKCKI